MWSILQIEQDFAAKHYSENMNFWFKFSSEYTGIKKDIVKI